MNFGFTKTKVITLIIISIIIGITSAIINSGNVSYDYYAPSFFELMADNLMILISGFILSFIIIYLIWSLIQKKK